MPAEVKQNSAAPPAPAADGRVVELYRRFVLELEHRRVQLGLSHERANDLVGLQDGYLAKLFHADDPSGRYARWPTLDLIVQTFWPDGYDIIIKPHRGPRLTKFLLKHRIKNAAAVSDRKLRRELLAEIGKKGGAARAMKLSRSKRIAIAKRANRARNKMLDAERRSALACHAKSVGNGRLTPEQRRESARRAACARWRRSEPEERGR